MIAERLAEPGKEAPVLEPLEPVHDDGKRLRSRRNIEIAADGKAFVAEDGELHFVRSCHPEPPLRYAQGRLRR
jgi:hypothetical protein